MSVTSSGQPILEIRNLVKKYGELTAVDHLNLSIREGICFGLLGPNGAGKTTTIEMIEGITEPTSGEILYRGRKVDRHFNEKIGIQFQSTALQDRLTVKEVLVLFTSFYKRTVPLPELIDWCNLGELLNRDSGKLSGGQKQRVLLALSLLNDPDLVFLDEPTTGLDPKARRDFWTLVDTIKAKKKTIVITTHYMEEASELCDEIGIMSHGKIILQGDPDQLLRDHFQGLSIQIPRADFNTPADSIPGSVFMHPEWVEIQTHSVNETLKALIERGVSLSGVQVRSRNLEDLFLELTRKGIQA